MRKIKTLLICILAVSPLVLFAQANYIVPDQNVCGDTFSVEVQLEHTGLLTGTQFGVFYDGSEIELLDSTILVSPSLTFVNETVDSISFTFTFSPAESYMGNTALVELRFVRIDPGVTMSKIRFKSDNPVALVTDDNNNTILADTTEGTILFEVFGYNDCPMDIVTPNDPNECGAVVNWTPPTLNDCDNTGMEMTPSQNPGDFFPIGTTTLSYTAENGNGDRDTCEFSITVEDTEPPMVQCPSSITVTADLNGTITVNNIEPISATDNCSPPDPLIEFRIEGATNRTGLDDASGLFNEGTNTVTYIVTDTTGLQDSCSFIVEVEPNPNNSEVNILLNSDDNLQCSDTSFVLDVYVDDSVSLNTLQFSIDWDTSFLALCQVIPGGSPNPNMASYSGLQNDSTPLIKGQLGYIFTSFNSEFMFSDNYLLFSVEFKILDNSMSGTVQCGVEPLAPEGSRDRNIIPVNCNTFQVDLGADNEDPVVQFCPNDVTFYADDNCMATVTYPDPLFMDNCDGDSLTGVIVAGSTSGSSFNKGTTAVRYEYTDNAGNGPAFCAFTVTVLDTIAPELICQDVTLYLDNSGTVMLDSADAITSVNDNCPIVFVSDIQPSVFTCDDLGVNTSTITISDDSNNTDTCTLSVTILDTVPPVAVCQDITINLDGDGNASISPEDVDGGSNDNCDSIRLDINNTNFTCSDLGPNPVLLTVTDSTGNTDTCTAIVTVVDTLLFVNCKDITVELDINGIATIAEDSIFESGGKACAGAMLSFDTDTTSFDCSDIGDNILTLIVTDTDNNTASCTAIATVIETIPPDANCRAVSTIYLDDNGMVSIANDFINNGSTDNCGIDSFHTDITGFTCLDIGPNQVTLTVFDGSGNSDQCTGEVRVADTIPPLAACMDVTVELDENGNASITPNDVENGSTDNCAVDSLALSDVMFDCNDVGIQQNVFLYAFDQSGNRDSCSAIITVEDNQRPGIICPPDVLQVINDNSAIINNIGPVSTFDNCRIDQITFELRGATTGFGNDDASGSEFNVGITTVVYTVEDESGNVDSCSFEVELILNPNVPFIDCPDNDREYCTAPGRCDTTIENLDLFVFTPQGVNLDSITWTKIGSTNESGSGDVSGTMFNVGSTRVEYTAYFDSDTTLSCIFFVTVNDKELPVIVEDLRDTTLYATTDSCNLFYSWTDPVVTDNCPIDSLEYNIIGRPNNPVGTFTVGMDTIVYEITDKAGNQITTSFIVTVLDTIAPEIVCPMDTTIVVPPGTIDTIVNDLTWLSASDNCGLDDIFYSLRGATNRNSAIGDSVDASGERFNFGTTTVTYFATDDSGNIDSCSFNVRVNTFLFPSFSCPNDTTLFLDTLCMASIDTLPANADLSAFDSVYYILRGVVSDTGSNYIGNRAYQQGTTIGTYYFELNGEVDSCSFEITVSDSLPPIIQCPFSGDTTIIVPRDVTDTIVNNLTPLSITDNCDLVGSYYILTGSTNATSDTTLNADASGERFNLGSTTVTYFGYDASGNIDSCSIEVIVTEQLADIVCPMDTILFTSDSTCFGSTSQLAPSFTAPFMMDQFFSIISGASIDTVNGSIDNSYQFQLGTSIIEYLAISGTDSLRCSFNIEVRDTFAPNIVCQQDTALLIDSISPSYPYGGFTVGFSDNCGVDTGRYVFTSGTGFSISGPLSPSNLTLSRGVNQIESFVFDASGNSDSCTQFISVVGFECPENAVFNTNPGVCYAILNDLDLNFDPDSLVTDIFYEISGDTNYVVSVPGLNETASGDTLAPGFYELTYTIVNLNNDTSSCTTLIRVIDAEAPSFTNCPTDTIELQSTLPGCGTTFNIATPIALDNCVIDTIVGNIEIGDTLGIGITEIQYIAFDNNNLSDTCTYFVNVLERDLELNCPDSLVLDIYGNIISDSGNLIDSVSTINCDSIQVFFSAPQAFLNCVDTTAMVSQESEIFSGDTLTHGEQIARFEISNEFETVNCEVRFIVLVPNGPSILQENVEVCEGSAFALNSIVNDTLDYQFSWTFNGNTIGTSDSILISNPGIDQSGFYYLLSQTDLGCEYLDSVFVQINPNPEIDIISNYQGCLAEGDSVSLCGVDRATTEISSWTWITPVDTTMGDSCYIIDSFALADIGRYTVFATNQFGCIDSMFIDVDTASNLPTPLITASDTTICAGERIDLRTPELPFDSVQYVWIIDTNEVHGLPDDRDTFEFNGIMPAGDSVTYRLFTTNGECSSDTTSLTVFIDDVPEINATSNSPIVCATDTDTIFLNADQLDTNTTITEWIWFGPNAFIDTAQNSFLTNLTDTLSGAYTVRATAENGCSSTETVFILTSDTFPDFNLTISQDTICLGSTVAIETDFSSSIGFQYDWSQSSIEGGLMSDSDSSSVRATPTATGDYMYNLVITIEDCISDTMQVALNVQGPPNLGLTYNGPFVCLTGDTTITLQDTLLEAIDYVWTTPSGEIFDSSFIQIDSASLEDAGFYLVQASGTNGCVAFDSIEVIILNTLPTPSITGASNYCPGDDIMLSVLNPMNFVTYNWTGPNNYADTGQMVTILNAMDSDTGMYFVQASIDQCVSLISPGFTIDDILDGPIASSQQFNVQLGDTLVGSVDLENFDSNIQYEINILSAPEQGQYTLTTSDTGLVLIYIPDELAAGVDSIVYSICPASCPVLCDDLTNQGVLGITIIQNECVVNNVITPDNDGFNEFLIIDCLRAGASQFPDNELIILNQWGDEIYRASPYDNTWDGTYEGEPVPDGTYFYIFKESDGVPVQKGFITVIR